MEFWKKINRFNLKVRILENYSKMKFFKKKNLKVRILENYSRMEFFKKKILNFKIKIEELRGLTLRPI